MADQPIRILSTRPLEAALLEQAAGNGILIDTLPFIVTEPVVEPALHNQILDLSRHPLTAVFTSMNAVEAVAQKLKQTDSHVVGWRVYCIGHATRQLVQQHFGKDTIAGTAVSAATLANVIARQAITGRADVMAGQPSGVQNSDIREVFFFCGDQRRDELPEKLQQQGIRVNELVVYRTVQTPHKVEPVYDGVVFFSPSAVHSFFTVNSLPAGTLLFAIGQTTADTIRSYTSNRTIFSGSPEKEALIRQVIDYYNIKP